MGGPTFEGGVLARHYGSNHHPTNERVIVTLWPSVVYGKYHKRLEAVYLDHEKQPSGLNKQSQVGFPINHEGT